VSRLLGVRALCRLENSLRPETFLSGSNKPKSHFFAFVRSQSWNLGETNRVVMMQRMFRYTFFRILLKNARKSYLEVCE
jgi:hypothetical protein